MKFMTEPARQIPVVHETDVCVVGAGTSGVCAAVRAARLGVRVALVEQNGYFGGVGTAGLVNIWHCLRDLSGRREIIGGLTREILDRLQARDAARPNYPSNDPNSPRADWVLNPEELKLELDILVREAGVRPFLHAHFAAPLMADGELVGVAIEDKSGRRAIRARCFIDASGDGDLLARVGVACRRPARVMPPTACAYIQGLGELAKSTPGFSLAETVFDEKRPGALRRGFLWSAPVIGASDVTMLAGTRVFEADCADADQLTEAELEGRRQIRAIFDLLRRDVAGADRLALLGLPSYIGIRETRHLNAKYSVAGEELMRGAEFADAIGYGTYPVDIHHPDRPGITFRYLDGRQQLAIPGRPGEWSRWRSESEPTPDYYQIPYRCLVPAAAEPGGVLPGNLLAAGRLVDADESAYGALRVMVNCNQVGEAAAAAAVLALESGAAASEVPADRLRDRLKACGALLF